MKKTSKIYVAGHEGLVGSTILKKLKDDGFNNIIVSKFKHLDLRRQKDVETFFEKEKPEYVFLAAAKVGGILANDTYKAEFIYDNLTIAANVIHSSYKYGVKKLLNLGSSCIYPKNCQQPMKEEYLLSGYLEPTNEPYAMAKIAAVKMCRYYNEQYHTNFISVMPTNLYGFKDNFNLETSHVLPGLIRKLHLAKLLSKEDFCGIYEDLNKNPLGYNFDNKIIIKDKNLLINSLEKIGIKKDSLTLWGTGKPYREFLFVDDLAQAVIFLMKNYNYEDIGEIVNIGSGIDVSIKDLANLIKKIVGFKGEIKFDKEKPDGTYKKLLDVSKINGLGWKYKIELEEGIKKVYNHYKGEISSVPFLKPSTSSGRTVLG